MKNWKKYASFVLAIAIGSGMTACGDENIEAEAIQIEDLAGFWFPAEGIDSTSSVLTSIHVDGINHIWVEYDQYGNPTQSYGAAYTDGITLTLEDVPLIGVVDIPIGDEDTLVTDDGEVYWIKGDPGFIEKTELSLDYHGRWYHEGDSEYGSVLTLNEDGICDLDGTEGTYAYREYDEVVGEKGTIVHRQEISLTELFDKIYYLASDGQVLMHWADSGDYYIHENALGNVKLLAECSLTSGSFIGQDYVLRFKHDFTLSCEYFDGTIRNGIWELNDGDTAVIMWDDGGTDEALVSGKMLTLNSTGETLENPW